VPGMRPPRVPFLASVLAPHDQGETTLSLLDDPHGSIGRNKPHDWQPAASHKSWCDAAVPFSRNRAIGDTAMSSKGCNCGNNPLARSLRRLAALQRAEAAS
jgi:hypothetical protein